MQLKTYEKVPVNKNSRHTNKSTIQLLQNEIAQFAIRNYKMKFTNLQMNIVDTKWYN